MSESTWQGRSLIVQRWEWEHFWLSFRPFNIQKKHGHLLSSSFFKLASGSLALYREPQPPKGSIVRLRQALRFRPRFVLVMLIITLMLIWKKNTVTRLTLKREVDLFHSVFFSFCEYSGLRMKTKLPIDRLSLSLPPLLQDLHLIDFYPPDFCLWSQTVGSAFALDVSLWQNRRSIW